MLFVSISNRLFLSNVHVQALSRLIAVNLIYCHLLFISSTLYSTAYGQHSKIYVTGNNTDKLGTRKYGCRRRVFCNFCLQAVRLRFYEHQRVAWCV